MDRLLAMAVLLPTMCCGCATIMAGKTETVRINSEPQGVEVVVDGAVYTTPVIVSLARDSDHYVNFPNGQRVDITRHFEAAVLGNILLGGVVGIVVDAVTGAATGNLEPDRLLYKNGKVYNEKSKRLITPGGEEVREPVEAEGVGFTAPRGKQTGFGSTSSAGNRSAPSPSKTQAAPPPPASVSTQVTDADLQSKIRRFADANPPYGTDPNRWLKDREAEFGGFLTVMSGCVIGELGGGGSRPMIELLADDVPRAIRAFKASRTPAERLVAARDLSFTLKLLKRQWRADHREHGCLQVPGHSSDG